MKIINGTSHQISIYSEGDCYAIQGGRKLIRKTGAQPAYVIDPGSNLNAVKENKLAPTGDYPFTVKGGVQFTDADPIPDADLVIVSNLYRAACIELGRDVSTLGTVDGAVYEDENAVRPCGCIAIAVG